MNDASYVGFDGSLEWRNAEGQLHREGDLPAFYGANGSEYYYRHGDLHRDGDNPAIICPRGNTEYWKHGLRHRDGDKPAVIWNDGTQIFYKNDKLHRLGGPAYITGKGWCEWYVDGVQYSCHQFDELFGNK